MRGDLLDPKPLLDWIDRHPEVVEGWGPIKNGEIASAMGRIGKARTGTKITYTSADKICTLMHVHMADVFGDVYWTAPL